MRSVLFYTINYFALFGAPGLAVVYWAGLRSEGRR